MSRLPIRAKWPALLVLLVLASCDGAPTPQPPGATLEPASGSSAPTVERLFILDDRGFQELSGNDRILIAARPEGAFIYDAAVSPDGTDVALAIQPPPRQTPTGYDFGVDLYLARDGGDPVPVAIHERIAETMSRPVWLPGSEALLFAVLGRDETGAADLRIERLDLGSGGRERFVEDALEPALSPDAASLAYVHYDPATGAEVIRVLDLETGVSRPLLVDHQRMSNVANLAWSPDATRLAFAASDPITLLAPAGGGRAVVAHPTLRDVWLANLDGSDLRRITEIADASLSLAWAADNRHLYAIGDTGFWRLDTADGALELIGAPSFTGRVQTLIP
jgi:Tol biopolymer transport system component